MTHFMIRKTQLREAGGDMYHRYDAGGVKQHHRVPPVARIGQPHYCSVDISANQENP
jgi:hypothetical protein